MSVFDFRSYIGSYLSCFYSSRPKKFTAFIVESVEKNKSISSTHGGFKILPGIPRKRLFEEKYIIFL